MSVFWGHRRHTSSRPAKPLKFIFIRAKYNGTCDETGYPITAGERILYETKYKSTYCDQSEIYWKHAPK